MNKKRKTVIVILTGFLFCVIFSGCETNTSISFTDNVPLLRLHIRANSNLEKDQAVKLKVRDAVSKYIESELYNVTDLETAKKEVKKRFSVIEAICDGELRKEGLNYVSGAKLNKEFFPTRVYGDVILESGNYDALIIALGEGRGDNWWCVIYPPLCYIEAKDGGAVYKSKIGEIIKSWFS